MKTHLLAVAALTSLTGLGLMARSDPPTADWPMWGGTADRNMVSTMKGLPTTWDVKTKKNVKWVAELGSQSYGNPVVANGVVLVGTNNEGMRDAAVKGDKGVLMAFGESDGQFLWQSVHDKLAAGRTIFHRKPVPTVDVIVGGSVAPLLFLLPLNVKQPRKRREIAHF